MPGLPFGLLLVLVCPIAVYFAFRAFDLQRGWQSLNQRYSDLRDQVNVRVQQANHRARTLQTMSNTEVANGEAWSLANEAFAAHYLESPSAVVYRPMTDPPIPAWLALVWTPDNHRASRLADVAERLGLSVGSRRGRAVPWASACEGRCDTGHSRADRAGAE